MKIKSKLQKKMLRKLPLGGARVCITLHCEGEGIGEFNMKLSVIEGGLQYFESIKG